MRRAIKICLLLYGFALNAQPKVVFDKYSHNYGPVSSQWLIPAYFTFTNEGDQPLAILLIEKNPDVIVKFENRFFGPDENGTIEVFFDNNELGNFREELWVYTNQSDEPVKLIIKGRNVDILECVNDKTRDKEYCTIYVIDKNSRNPVHNADLHILRNNDIEYVYTTDKKGRVREKIEKGQYNISVGAISYNTLNGKLRIGYSGQVFIYELEAAENNQKQHSTFIDSDILDGGDENKGPGLPSENENSE